MKLTIQQQAFARDVGKLIAYINDQGYSCTLGDAYRSQHEAQYNAQQGKGIVKSLHTQRMAIDLNLFSPAGEFLQNTEDHRQFGIFWEKLDPKNRWGGNFKSRPDGNHYERTLT